MGGDSVAILQPGLPNITGYIANNGHAAFSSASGAFANTYDKSRSSDGAANDGGTYTFDASRCSSVYGNSNTVQPPAYSLIPQVKY